MADTLPACGYNGCERPERPTAEVLQELLSLAMSLDVAAPPRELGARLREGLAKAGFQLNGICGLCCVGLVAVYVPRGVSLRCGHPQRQLPEIVASVTGLAARILIHGGPARLGAFGCRVARCVCHQLAFELAGQCRACAMELVASAEGVARG